MHFVKLQGAGNDYIFVDGINSILEWPDIARRVSDRHFGIGADGLIVAAPSDEADLRMRMYNADGSEGEMCGNGIRCLAKFVLERSLVQPSGEELVIETGAGIIKVLPKWEGGLVRGAIVDMGSPILKADDIPVDTTRIGRSAYDALDRSLSGQTGVKPEEIVFDAPLDVAKRQIIGTAVSMGNPHFVNFGENPPAEFPLEELGPLVETAEAFPNRVNFHVVFVESRTRLITRTWERGSGQTLACGTGAAAMVVAARLHGMVDDAVHVVVPGGDLLITWPGQGSVTMEGDAVEVFSGEWSES